MKITNCIICEDIRQELGNKHSLMGVYDDSIIFKTTPDKINVWPKSKQLSFFIRLIFDKEDLSDLSYMNIESNLNGTIEEVLRMEISFVPKTKKMNIAATIGNFTFKNKGNLCFNLKVYNQSGSIINEFLNFYSLRIDESDKM